jgi:hypothetical protein
MSQGLVWHQVSSKDDRTVIWRVNLESNPEILRDTEGAFTRYLTHG